MNIICTICSDLLSADQECVSTACGHVFHANCLETWFRTSKVCPMDQRPSPSIIKLFFEIDDSKATLLQMDSILNANEELTGKMKKLEATNSAQNLELQKNRIEIAQLKEAIKVHERNKQTDDMALAAFKALKEDSMINITNLQSEMKNLKLDLLAERELRKIHQGKLHNFDPGNDDYNPDAASVNFKARPRTSSLGGAGQSTTKNELSVEAKPTKLAAQTASASSTEEIPKKLIKSNGDSLSSLNRRKEILQILNNPKLIDHQGIRKQAVRVVNPPANFKQRITLVSSTVGSEQKIHLNLVSPTSNSKPSTSAAAFSFSAPSTPVLQFTNSKPVAFGDGPAFPAPLPSSSSSASTSNGLFQMQTSQPFILPSKFANQHIFMAPKSITIGNQPVQPGPSGSNSTLSTKTSDR